MSEVPVTGSAVPPVAPPVAESTVTPEEATPTTETSVEGAVNHLAEALRYIVQRVLFTSEVDQKAATAHVEAAVAHVANDGEKAQAVEATLPEKPVA